MDLNKPVDNNTIAKALGVTGFSPLANFLKLHVAQALDDRVGNDPNIRNAANIEAIDLGPERHGYDSGVDNILYNKVNPAQDYYQSGIYTDIEKEKARQAELDKHTGGDDSIETDVEKAAELAKETEDEKMRAHDALMKTWNFQAFRNNIDI